jgi:putative ABC transport system permease protein
MSDFTAPDAAETSGSPPPSRGYSIERIFGFLAEGVGIALETLFANKVRSALTILGVAVGVSVVVTLAALITGIRSEVMVAFESAGPKNFSVMRFDFTSIRLDGSNEPEWWLIPVLTPFEADRIAELPAIDEALYMIGTSTGVRVGSREMQGINTQGTGPGWPKYQPGTFVGGRDMTQVDVDRARAVVIISRELADELFGQLDPIGRRVRMSVSFRGVQEDFTVIGVYEPAQNVFSAANKYWAVVPYTSALKRFKVPKDGAQIYVVPSATATQDEAQDQVISTMRSLRGLRPRMDNDFALIGSQQILTLFNRLTGIFFLVMLALSSAGLLVGGVGVIGIMLISVTERTREIGIRKAVGATRQEILWQFLVESAVMTVLGGAAGMILGALVAFGVAQFTPVPARIPLWSVGAALLMALITGILFGLVPAYRAAKLEPVVALRAE